jgi:hypothetical protein
VELNAMRFKCESTYNPKPSSPEGYITANLIDVFCLTAGGEETVAARLAVDYLDILRAESEGQSVLHVCDADSSAWMKVYESTIDPAIDFAEIRKDFGFDDPIDGILFLHSAVFHPNVLSWRRFIIDSVCRMFPSDTAMVMWRHTMDLEPTELASLGFRIVAGSDMLFRPNMLKNEYASFRDDRDPIDLIVAKDAQAVVEDLWAALDDPDLGSLDGKQ